MNSLKTKTFNSETKYGSFQNMSGLQNIVSSHKFAEGQTIFYEGHLPYGIFILLTGEVELKYVNSKVEKVSSPALIGISAFMNKTVYSGTARAITACEIFFLSTSVYLALAEKNDPLLKLICQ
jgi:CRP-like cAMP-binding protein